ncbi:MAG: ATP synthase subunit I [Gracilibacteraceae bacterium]|jgi:hypothetical protein|nr:ATP synthase subunit I [Gracilibacteraceae bacterium]
MSLRQVFLTETLALAVALALSVWRADAGFIGLFAGFTVGILNHLLLGRDMRRAVALDLRRALAKYLNGLLLRLALITAAVALCARYLPGWTFPLAAGVACGVIVPLALTIAGGVRA